MCTVTWLATPEGYHLFTNRDERHTRADAAPPEEHRRSASRVLAPIDPDGGGTWVSVNSRGVALCLLNEYAVPEDLDATRVFVSRGQLVMDLADAPSRDALQASLRAVHLPDYRSFRLLVLEPGAMPAVARWDRSELTIASPGEPDLPLVSSPLDPVGASAARRAELRRLRAVGPAADPRILDTFHRSHAPERGSYSPCMHGEKARTRSRTRIAVTHTHVEMAYTDGSPCETRESTPLRLRRA